MAKSKNILGSWAFLIGLILAVLFSFITANESTVVAILAVIGIIVGLLNVASEETTPFLISGLVLIIASSLGGGVAVGGIEWLGRILSNLLVIFVPATIVVAVRNVFSLASR